MPDLDHVFWLFVRCPSTATLLRCTAKCHAPWENIKRTRLLASNNLYSLTGGICFFGEEKSMFRKSTYMEIVTNFGAQVLGLPILDV